MLGQAPRRLSEHALCRILLQEGYAVSLFASFVGTMEIFDQWQRELVTGYIINHFSGQKSLLTAALVYLKTEDRDGCYAKNLQG